MLNGIPVTEIWVPRNGSKNGTLSCVAENARPKANLEWNLVKSQKSQLRGAIANCSQIDYHCTSTLYWLGEWKDLLNSTQVTCTVRQENDYKTELSATLRFLNDSK